MKRPHLNRRLLLEAPVRVPDGAGGFSVTWHRLGVAWAEVTPRGGRETASGGVSVSRGSFAITLRGAAVGSPDRPQPHQRFREADRVFNIQTVAERDPQGRYLTCLVQEEMIV